MSTNATASIDEQRRTFALYMRTFRTNYKKAVREMDRIFRQRRMCPLEKQMRIRRFEEAREFLKFGEAGMFALNHAYAINQAAFKPGDRIVCTTTMSGYEPKPRRFLVLDVQWMK